MAPDRFTVTVVSVKFQGRRVTTTTVTSTASVDTVRFCHVTSLESDFRSNPHARSLGPLFYYPRSESPPGC